MKTLTDSIRTVTQMPERAMRAPLIKGIVVTLSLIIVLALTVGAWMSWFLSDWTIPFTTIPISSPGGWLAGMGSLAAAYYAFIPAAALAVSFFIDPVADAVEAKHFPNSRPARERPLIENLWIAGKTALLALAINIPLIPFYFLFPPLPALINGYLLGREYFTMAALRRNPPKVAATLRSHASLGIWFGGAILALIMTIPLLNLVAPVFGAGLMTHIYNRARIKAEEAARRL